MWIRIDRMRIRIHKILSMRILYHRIRLHGPKLMRIRPDPDPHHWFFPCSAHHIRAFISKGEMLLGGSLSSPFI